MAKGEIPPEETLDPEDWDSMRALGHRMLDDMVDYLFTSYSNRAMLPALLIHGDPAQLGHT